MTFSLHSKAPKITLFIVWDLVNNIEVTNFESLGGNFAGFYSVEASMNFTITKAGHLVNLYEGLKLNFWRAESPSTNNTPLSEES